MKKIIVLLLSFSLLIIPLGNANASGQTSAAPYAKTDGWVKYGPFNAPIPETTTNTIDSGEQVATAEPTVTAVSTEVPTEAPTADPSVTPDPNYVPTLDEFAAQVRNLGYLGIWSEGLFAFQAYGMGWGQVPGSRNTASYATYESYGAYFIHDYLGGYKLYAVRPGTRVAVIRPNQIDWFVINNTIAFMGTPNGQTCGYQEPYVSWGQDLATGAHFTTLDIIHSYYSMPFAIQTCYCQNGTGGVYILTGVWDN